jgi:hypothetical protein
LQSDIQWCLTVPAIWDEDAKQEMKRIAEIAGLIGPGASQHPLLIVLEPEAAAVYCDKHMKAARGGLERGDVFLIAGKNTRSFCQIIRVVPTRPSLRKDGLVGNRRWSQEVVESIPGVRTYSETN